ncbi:uncharacterized protein LOC121045830 [Ixodes scapularis]|uniref:uncharacterized protein LOC121045830 n=1 Tax=Ixodes scapularis TaxID=6945 RepID=UPI001AD60EC1|nr:uncharacterized protein LOC121045830 [Ixodes scapularis]
MAFPAHVRRCLCFLTEILFLAGLIWLLLLFLATLLGGSQGAAERAGGLIIGMAFLLPAPLLFIFDLGLRRYSHGSRQVVPETSSWSSGVLWPAARRSRRAPDPSPRSSPDVLPEEPGASAMPQWWAERPPTYDEAMRMPKLEELGPRVHQSGRGHVIFHVNFHTGHSHKWILAVPADEHRRVDFEGEDGEQLAAVFDNETPLLEVCAGQCAIAKHVHQYANLPGHQM